MDDCHHVRVNNFDVDVPTHDQPLVRVIQSTDRHHFRISVDTARLELPKVEGDQFADIKLVGNDFTGVNVSTRTDGCGASALKMLNNLE